MHYSPAEFRRVQHQFLEQFQLKTSQFYDQNVNSSNLIEYKKILNQIKTRRKQTVEKKEKYHCLHKRGVSSDSMLFRGEKLDKGSSTIDIIQPVQEELEDCAGFYLTEKCWEQPAKKKGQTSQFIAESRSKEKNIENLIPNSRMLLKSRAQIPPSSLNETQNENQNLNIDNLNDRIYGQYSVFQCLKHDQSQVEEAIFCFKKRVIEIQEQLNSQDIKSKEIDRLFAQNNNQMLHAKHTNQQVKSAFLKTKKHFDLDLEGRRQIQLKFSEKNKEQFDQSIVNHIYMKKMKQHILEQQNQLSRLDQIRHELEKKEKKYKSIYLKEQELYKAYEEIKAIEPRELAKKPIMSILDKDFEQFDRQQNKKMEKDRMRDKKTKIATNKEQYEGQKAINKKKKLSSVVKEIVSLYNKIKHQQSSKITEFKLLINERDEKEAQLLKTVSRMAEIYQTMFQQTQIVDPVQKQRLEALMGEVRKLLLKNNSINASANIIEQRLKFCIAKLLNILKKITIKWMKTDKLVNKYIDNMYGRFCEFNSILPQLTSKSTPSGNNSIFKANQILEQRQLNIDDSRNMLISSFENWQQYMGFVDILHQTPYIYRSMSKSKLFKLFKRIIKTKITHKSIPTEKIFEKALLNSFDEGRNTHTKRIENLLSVLRGLNHFLTKVESGEIRLNCALNYDLPIEVRQTESNDVSKAPSRNELERFSTNKEITIDRNSFGAMLENVPMFKETHKIASQTNNLILSSNLRKDDVISQLKKKKLLKPVLNIHQFYEDLREEIQKVNKISAF